METKIERLSIGKLEITPYFYDEYHGYKETDPLKTIEVKAKLSIDQFLELVDFMSANQPPGGYLPVIRHGISENPVEMRFGPYLWSKDDEKIKIAFRLVSPIIDEERNILYWGRGRDSNVQKGHINQVETMEKLIETLRAKGIIDDEDVLRISENEAESLQKRWIEYQEVDDIDNNNPVGVAIRYKKS